MASKGETSTARLKVVVRRLPPDLPEAIFWSSVSPWIIREKEVVERDQEQGRERVLWSCYRAGQVRTGAKDKDDVHSRAYLTFRTAEGLVTFVKAYDGWSFKDKKGTTSVAVVEFAPYQRAVPTAPTKPDPRQGTIEEDADYTAFITALAAPDPVEKVEEITIDKKAPRSTALLDHLRAQKAAKLTKRATYTGLSTTRTTKRTESDPARKKGNPIIPGAVATVGAKSKGKGKAREGNEKKGKGGTGRNKNRVGGAEASKSLAPPPLSASAFPALNQPIAVVPPPQPQLTIAARPAPPIILARTQRPLDTAPGQTPRPPPQQQQQQKSSNTVRSSSTLLVRPPLEQQQRSRASPLVPSARIASQIVVPPHFTAASPPIPNTTATMNAQQLQRPPSSGRPDAAAQRRALGAALGGLGELARGGGGGGAGRGGTRGGRGGGGGGRGGALNVNGAGVGGSGPGPNTESNRGGRPANGPRGRGRGGRGGGGGGAGGITTPVIILQS